MRILVAAQEAPPLLGGPSTWLLDLLQALRPLHQVGLLVPHGRDLAALERAGVAPVFLAPSLTSDDPREAARIAAEIASFARRQEVDLVHLAGAPLAHLAPALAEEGIPSVLTLLEIPPNVETPRGASPAAPVRVTAVSRTAAAGSTDLVIPPGVDLDRFQPGDRAAARRSLDLSLDRPVLLMIERLLVSKGALEALEALRDLADLDPLLVIAGDGPDARRIDARVRFLGLEDRVRQTGAVAAGEIPRLYQAADLVLLPARDEAAAGMGLAAIEAAACALPVVASNEGALAEVVEDGRTGLLVPARDARALAVAVRALVEDRARASVLGRAARRRAEEAFGRDLMAERYAEVYEAVAESPHPRDLTPLPPSPIALPPTGRGGKKDLGVQFGVGGGAPLPVGGRAMGEGTGVRSRIAVFMPTWRCRPWLPRAIQAVLDQTWPLVDLYVADDASGDLDAEIEERFPTVTFLTLRDQGGPYRIDNLLLSLTESELVAFHDADDWSRPDRFATQVEYLLDRGFDGCGSWYRLVDVHGDPIGFTTVPEHASLSLRDSLGDQVLHPTTLYRREVFDRLGGFDAETRFSGDTEMIYRSFPAFDLGNVQRFLYERTVLPGSLTQSAETGANTPARVAYLERVCAAAEAVRTGAAPPPPPGMSLTGRPIGQPSTDLILRLRPGRGNRTLKELG